MSAKVQAPEGNDAGFTLVEALVSLSLVALIMLVAFVGLRLGSDAWARTERHSQLSGEVATAQRFLREAIEQAYPGVVILPGAASVATFHGTETALEISAPVPADLAAGGRHRLYFGHSVQDGEVTVAWAPERNQRPIGGPPARSTQATLITGVRGVSFAYFGRVSGEPEVRWHRQWIGQRDLPKLIRIEARLADGTPARWPVLDAAPRTDVDANCVLDLLSHNCRGR